MFSHRVSILTGHYGTGKTEVSVNLALALAAEGEQVMLADLDIVNPYFRSRERRPLLGKAGVRGGLSPPQKKHNKKRAFWRANPYIAFRGKRGNNIV